MKSNKLLQHLTWLLTNPMFNTAAIEAASRDNENNNDNSEGSSPIENASKEQTTVNGGDDADNF